MRPVEKGRISKGGNHDDEKRWGRLFLRRSETLYHNTLSLSSEFARVDGTSRQATGSNP